VPEKTPEMSVVILTRDGLPTIRRTLRHLRNQTARDRIELVIVGPAGLGGISDQDGLDEFASARMIEASPFRTAGAAFAAGVRAARGRIVGYAEEHSFPEPGWAAALIEAHKGPWAAVGGVLENANPATGTSWASLVCDFGPEAAPIGGGEASELGGHHSTYKREVLARYEPDLDHLLEVEWVLQEELRASGERLYREPRAVSRHLNASRLRSHLAAQVNGGRLFAGNRARLRRWSILRRAAWVGGSPLMPLLRLARSLPHLRRIRHGDGPSPVSARVLGLFAHSLGQMAGYAFGPGRAAERRLDIDLCRRRDLAHSDQAELDATPLGELPRLLPAGR
jgi:Glycosyl transferase family 2